MKRIIKVSAGWFLFFLGIVGCVLPGLQGILFIAIGLLILSEEIVFIKKLLHPLEQKYPVQFKHVHAFRHKLFQKLRRLIRRKRSPEPEGKQRFPHLPDEV